MPCLKCGSEPENVMRGWTLPFSCPFRAAKSGKQRRKETENLTDSSRSDAKSSNCQRTPANALTLADRRRSRADHRRDGIGRRKTPPQNINGLSISGRNRKLTLEPTLISSTHPLRPAPHR